MNNNSPTLRVNLDGKRFEVSRSRFVAAKTAQLREFGYKNLTQAEVDSQIDALLAGKTFENGLTVIGMMMKGEVQHE